MSFTIDDFAEYFNLNMKENLTSEEKKRYRALWVMYRRFLKDLDDFLNANPLPFLPTVKYWKQLTEAVPFVEYLDLLVLRYRELWYPDVEEYSTVMMIRECYRHKIPPRYLKRYPGQMEHIEDTGFYYIVDDEKNYNAYVKHFPFMAEYVVSPNNLNSPSSE